jgi:putative AbiEii toxin of type IV toxin-antitoxin system
VILDEPDVYMHADLQRRLIRLVRSRYRQTIIATHSVEIMAEVEPESILVVDKDRRHSRFATSLPAVQEVIEHMGGVHNLHLARLASARKCLLVEGKDVEILRYLQSILRPGSSLPFDAVPHMSLGGWGGFHHAVGMARLLKDTGEERLRIYCIFDRDYRSSEELRDRMKRAREEGIDLHIWQRKEIENYLICPSVIHRLVASSDRGESSVALEGVTSSIDDLVRSLEVQTIELIASEIQRRQKGTDLQSAMRLARTQIRLVSQKCRDVTA